MAYLLQSNLAKSTLAEGINDAVTSLTVATGEGAKFPATGDFICIIHDSTGETNVEYVKCTGRTTDALTITRQTEDSARYPACAHALGSVIGLVISAGTLTEITDAVTLNTAKVTNATHTGDVTGATELTIAAKAVDVAMLADGTDGQLITWGADGVATTVATGDAGQILTSAGAGAPPTMAAVDISGDATPTLGGDLAAANKDITGLCLASYHAVYANGNSGNAKTIDWNNGQIQSIVWTDNCAITFTDPPGPGHFTLVSFQDATGGRTPTWPNTVDGPDSTLPTVSPGANDKDIWSFLYLPLAGDVPAKRYSVVTNTDFGVPA